MFIFVESPSGLAQRMYNFSVLDVFNFLAPFPFALFLRGGEPDG
jgi:hypothetical protein